MFVDALVSPARYSARTVTGGGGVAVGVVVGGPDGVTVGVGVAAVIGILIAFSGVSLLVLTVSQSSARIPPVSPEFGFHDHHVQLKSLAPSADVDPRYVSMVENHCWSDVSSSRDPNSPSRTGATFCWRR